MPERPKNDNPKLRALLAKKARELAGALVSKRFRDTLAAQINSMIRVLQFCEAGAVSKKKRTKHFDHFCQWLLAKSAEDDLGPLRDLPENRFSTLEKLFDAQIATMLGRKVPEISGEEFAALTKDLFVPKKKRGPHTSPPCRSNQTLPPSDIGLLQLRPAGLVLLRP